MVAGTNTGFASRRLIYSVNRGVTWLLPTTDFSSIFPTSALGVAYSESQNRWIAVGAGSSSVIVSSTDAVVWTSVPISSSVFSNSLGAESVHFSEDVSRWVVCGYPSSNIATMYSSDGITWAASGTSHTNYCHDLTYAPALQQWLSVGVSAADNLFTSPDGVTWTSLPSPLFPGGTWAVASRIPFSNPCIGSSPNQAIGCKSGSSEVTLNSAVTLTGYVTVTNLVLLNPQAKLTVLGSLVRGTSQ